MYKFINCCPHDIDVVDRDGNIVKIPKSDNPCRILEERNALSKRRAITSYVNNNSMFFVEPVDFNTLINLPDPQVDTFYIVSKFTVPYCHAAGRYDVVSVGEAVRDEQGNTIYVKGFTFHV